MKHRIIASWSLFASLLAASTAAFAAPERRFALLIGNNDGGPDTVPLRYARSDAEKLREVLVQLGGYAPGDILLLGDQSAESTQKALSAIEARIQKAKSESIHTTLLFYYSGHAKEGALRLGATRWPMAELRHALADSAADIKLGIIDSCQSGAITREKGGRPGPSFMFETDDGRPVTGMILISSSADDEDSQESDDLGGSFFTHYLTSGLRGDADESGDRRVTLGELYLYAYSKTVSETANTRSGVQHPTYSYDLSGNGNMVLTDLSMGKSGVVFAEALEGDYLIFDTRREQVAAEIKKQSGKARRLALPAGNYVLKKRLSDHLEMARFELGETEFYQVDDRRMERVEFQNDTAKGRAPKMLELPASSLKVALAYQSFLSSDTRSQLFPALPMLGMAFGIDNLIGGARLEMEAMFGWMKQQTLAIQDLRIRYNFVEAEMAASLLWTFGDHDYGLRVGPRAAGLYFSRSFPNDPILKSHTQDYFGVSPGVVGAVYFGLGDFSVEARGQLGLLPFGVDANRTLFLGELGLSLGYRL